eukprot:353171-Chlamydomonas_euryale.AAC.6
MPCKTGPQIPAGLLLLPASLSCRTSNRLCLDHPQARRVASISAGTSAQLDARARAASHTPMIKCFHAGVRWGITLPRDSIKSRAELATQLNNAFAGAAAWAVGRRKAQNDESCVLAPADAAGDQHLQAKPAKRPAPC